MRTTKFLPYVPFAAAALLNAIANLTNAEVLAADTQYLLMPLLILAVLVTLRPLRQPLALWLVLAQLFSWGGDLLLRASFAFGLGAFLLAHVAYLFAYTRRAVRSRDPWWRPRWAWVYVAWFAGLLAVLGPHAGGMLPAVALYGVALGADAFVAARTSRMLAVGGAVFVVSDSLLALRLFLPGFHLPASGFWVMATYSLAQALLAVGLTRAAQRRDVGLDALLRA